MISVNQVLGLEDLKDSTAGIDEKLEDVVDVLQDIADNMQPVNGVPSPTAEDINKVLTATGVATYGWETASGGDIMSGAQVGQVLTAIEDMGGNIIKGWTTPDEGLPAHSSSDSGKVLAIQGYSGGYAPMFIKPKFAMYDNTYSASQIEGDDKGGYYFNFPSDTVGNNASFYIPLFDSSYISTISRNTVSFTSTGYNAIMSAGQFTFMVVTLSFVS